MVGREFGRLIWKLIEHTRGDDKGQAELFDLAADPFEKQNFAAQHPDRVRELHELLERFRKDDLLELPSGLVGIAL